MRIGELARRTGVSVRSLRYYEQQGLLTPDRTATGYREFADTDVERVERVRLLFAAGMSSARIAEVLPEIILPVDASIGLADSLRPVRTDLVERMRGLQAAIDVIDGIEAACAPPARRTVGG